MADFDLVVRGGTLVDGTGGDMFEADVAVNGTRIAAVGKSLGRGKAEIDARGKLVTPGFVDIHTHYDGQVIWDDYMTPSSGHGVTTVLMGNCGVGFAPCLPENREAMIDVMEGVEDIPAGSLRAGMTWTWTSFPEYLDALGRRRCDVDFAAQIPHVPVRVHVMGKRGTNREPARADDMAQMAAIVREAVLAGAMGFTSSRAAGHRAGTGDCIPSTTAGEDELLEIAMALKEIGRGTFMSAADLNHTGRVPAEFELLARIAKASGCTVMFPLLQYHENPEGWRVVAEACAAARAAGARMYGQVVGRPVGLLYGLELTSHPFKGRATYEAIKHLPLAERARRMADPAVRASILSETGAPDDERSRRLARLTGELYRIGDPPNYSPPPEERLDHVAKRKGVDVMEVAYDILCENGGNGLIYHPARNFAHGNLDTVLDMMKRSDTVIGLGDGGAHVGAICDSSVPTFMLTYWTRDRKGERLSIPWAVKAHTFDTASAVGFMDRGVLKAGYKADLNVLDYDKLTLRAPRPAKDLPAGGTRLVQQTDGFDATIVSGDITLRHGERTGVLPGRLIRGAQPAPAAA